MRRALSRLPRADREAEELRRGGLLGDRDGEHHEAEHEGEDALGDGHLAPAVAAHGAEAEGLAAVECLVGEARSDAAGKLRGDVRADVGRGDLVAAAARDGNGDGRVEVRARDVAEGVDHDHQGGGDGEGARRGAAQDVQADGEDLGCGQVGSALKGPLQET